MEVKQEDVDRLFAELNKEAETSGYHLNPDVEFTNDLVEGLLVNEERYGYWACPCRLASGKKEKDLDIICPCDYRDPDIGDYDSCYCCLYVSEDILKGAKKAAPISERRLPEEERLKVNTVTADALSALSHPVWRCRVCGYLSANEKPPLVCPICKARRERFERFI